MSSLGIIGLEIRAVLKARQKRLRCIKYGVSIGKYGLRLIAAGVSLVSALLSWHWAVGGIAGIRATRPWPAGAHRSRICAVRRR